MHRRSAPNVKAGKVQKQNNWALDPGDYYRVPQPLPVVDRRRPGGGYRHLLRRGDVERFIELLPDWEELSRGLDAVVLAPGSHYSYGYHRSGVVHVCAWPVHLWDTTDIASYERDRPMLERLSVPAERRGREVLLRWTMPTARAFQLLDVFLHELGHHHDQMTTRSRREAARGEPYAEEYARRHGQAIWEAYLDAFEL